MAENLINNLNVVNTPEPITQSLPLTNNNSVVPTTNDKPPTLVESIQLLINSVQVAQKRGAYNLKEASLINTSVEVIVNHFQKENN